MTAALLFNLDWPYLIALIIGIAGVVLLFTMLPKAYRVNEEDPLVWFYATMGVLMVILGIGIAIVSWFLGTGSSTEAKVVIILTLTVISSPSSSRGSRRRVSRRLPATGDQQLTPHGLPALGARGFPV